MVRDVIDSDRLQGQPKESVVALLGKPSYEAPDGSYVTYVVKNVPPNVKSFDFVHILHIAFDASGKVASVRLRAD